MLSVDRDRQLFVSHGRQFIPLSGAAELEPLQLLGSSSAPLMRVPAHFLERLHDAAAPPSAVPGPLDGSVGVDRPRARPPDTGGGDLLSSTISEQTVPAATGTSPFDAPSAGPSHPPEDLIDRLGGGQRSSFAAVWQKMPAHLRSIKFDFHGPGWTPTVTTDLGDLLSEFSDVFLRPPSTLALGPCCRSK